jgi:isopentenyl phosphate kinase
LKIYVKLLDARLTLRELNSSSSVDVVGGVDEKMKKLKKNPIERSLTTETIFHHLHHLQKPKENFSH